MMTPGVGRGSVIVHIIVSFLSHTESLRLAEPEWWIQKFCYAKSFFLSFFPVFFFSFVLSIFLHFFSFFPKSRTSAVSPNCHFTVQSSFSLSLLLLFGCSEFQSRDTFALELAVVMKDDITDFGRGFLLLALSLNATYSKTICWVKKLKLIELSLLRNSEQYT